MSSTVQQQQRSHSSANSTNSAINTTSHGRLDQSDNQGLQQFPVTLELSARHYHHNLNGSSGLLTLGNVMALSSGDGLVNTTTVATPTTTTSSTIHQLKYIWIFWHYRRSKRTTKTWMDCQRILAELDTLEGFWRFFVQLRNPSMVKINQDYALFKRGIKPMWEDPVNVKGGQWIFVIQKSHENYRLLVDHVWNEIVLALVGSTFNSAIMNLVCGVVFSMRISCFTKISVWISDYTSVKEILVLGHELKRLTNFEDCIIFRRNDDMKVKFIL